MLALIVVLSVYTVVVLPFLEVRERGLLQRGRLISWLNIEGYAWESSAEPGELVVFSMRPEKAVLRLHVSRLWMDANIRNVEAIGDWLDHGNAVVAVVHERTGLLTYFPARCRRKYLGNPTASCDSVVVKGEHTNVSIHCW
jgi:hypothetical protein